jgi:hypothetical protein
MAPIAFAHIIHVPDDYTTIQAGIDASINGDTVLVGPGEYTESLNIATKNILLTSLYGTDSTIVDGRLTIGPNVDTTNVIRGFYFGPIEINDASYIAISNCSPIIEGNMVGGSYGIATGAISLSNSNGIIRNNIIRGVYGVGSANIITGSGGYPIIERNIIKDNVATLPEAAFLRVIWISSGILRYNVINNNYSEAGNIAEAYGLTVNGDAYEITNNTIAGNGIRSFNRGGAIFEFMVPQNGANVIIKNNIVAFNQCEMGVDATILDSTWTGWNYNLVYGNNGENYHGLQPGPYDIQDNPSFADSALHDYRLQANSPCIDAGDPSSPLDPDSTRADIGALFYNQSVGIDDDNSPSGPYAFELHQNYPNPFNAQTIIAYDLPKTSIVSLRIYDLTGRVVKGLIRNEYQSAGPHRFIWDGTDESGRPVATAIYLYELKVGEQKQVKAMIVIR